MRAHRPIFSRSLARCSVLAARGSARCCASVLQRAGTVREEQSVTKHIYEKHRVYDGRNITRRESDPPEGEACQHVNARGQSYASAGKRFCPRCGEQLLFTRDEIDAQKHNDGKAQERADYHQTLRAGLSGRKKTK